MSSREHWIWLQICVGAARNFAPILEEFGSIEDLYNANYLKRSVSPSITEKMLNRMEKYTLEDAGRAVDICDKNGWKIITFEDEAYPEKLKNIYDPPAVLYVDGQMPSVDDCLSIGVVGTRKPSPYSLKCARLLSKGIGRCGGIIVSGGALGIDSEAHRGAIASNAKTICVLGCGLGASYLSSNEELRHIISSNGAVITEYPPNTKATRFTFPQRNRIISGLCDGVLVVEAAAKSGSLITASCATAQNRDVFAVSCSMLDFRFEGTNRLLDDGAILVTSTKTIINHYASKYKLDTSKALGNRELLFEEYENSDITPEQDVQLTFENVEEQREQKAQQNEVALALKGDAKALYFALDESYMDVEEICQKSELDVSSVLTNLTLLELDGLVEAGMGKRYRRKR